MKIEKVPSLSPGQSTLINERASIRVFGLIYVFKYAFLVLFYF